MIEKTYEIISSKNIILNYQSNLTLENYDQKKVNENWEKEYSKSDGTIMNNPVLNLINYNKDEKQIKINVNFVEFKFLISQKKYKMKLNIQPIGVSGVILNEYEGKESILFSTRAHDTAYYQDFIELVPSGHIDKTFFSKDRIINYKENLIQEFVEETGLQKENIIKLETLCFVKDKINNFFDICCVIYTNLPDKEILKNILEKREYNNPQLIEVKEIKDFLQNKENKIVPTSHAILKCLYNYNN